MKNVGFWALMIVALLGFTVSLLATGLGLIPWFAGAAYCLILFCMGACSALVITD